MKNTLVVLLAAFSFTWLGNASAKESGSNKNSPMARVASEMDKYQADIRVMDREFAESLKSIREAYVQKRKSLRSKLASKLAAEQKKLTQAGDLDGALSLRDRTRRIEEAEITIPSIRSNNKADVYHEPLRSSSDPILGTWRWNNGADITNVAGGETSGNSTWNVIDAKQKIYRFNWSKFPADRVRLSANGRVLEGTKANDPTFRVWAVRID